MPKLKHLRKLRSAMQALRGNLSRSVPTLEKARETDRENFGATRNILRRKGWDLTIIDQMYSAINLIADCKSDALSIVKEQLSSSESQLCQDIFCALAHNLKRNGFFVEVGVGEGKSISNTYLLEKKFDWQGLLVEPCRSFHESIRKTRKAALDTRAASSLEHGEITFNESVAGGVYSYSANADINGNAKVNNKTVITYQVPTATLNTILQDHNAPRDIDFMSIDTEGSELDILSGIDLSRYRVGLFCIEHNFRESFIAALDAKLLPKGYRRVLPVTSSYDAWYLGPNILSKYISA
jgi:FkbM family methyltransferase